MMASSFGIYTFVFVFSFLTFSMLNAVVSHSQHLFCTILKLQAHRKGSFYYIINPKIDENHLEGSGHVSSSSSVINWSKY